MTCTKFTVIKSVFIVINLIFWILGVVIFAIGIHTRIIAKDLFHENESLFRAANLLIGTGVIIMFLGFLGCYGAVMKVRFLLTVYGLLLILIVVLEVITYLHVLQER